MCNARVLTQPVPIKSYDSNTFWYIPRSPQLPALFGLDFSMWTYYNNLLQFVVLELLDSMVTEAQKMTK